MTVPIINELDVDKTTAPMVLVLGQTGAGKSHFINRLAAEQLVRESARLFSCTSRPELVEVRVNEHDFLMVDTPGFNDTWRDSTRSDGRILSEIARTLTLQSQMGVKLRGILFLYDIRHPRMTGDKRRQIEMLKLICGPNNYSNVMLVTTHWPRSFAEQNEQGCALREADLRSEFWKDMIRGGSKMFRFDDDEDTARAIVGSLASKPDITLALQEEMAIGKRLQATTAGSFIVNARQDDEMTLKGLVAKMKGLGNNSHHGRGEATTESKEDLALEIDRLQMSIDSRLAAEERLQDDMVTRIRTEIREMDDQARSRKRRPTAAKIISWLIGVSELTAQVVQTVFSS